MHFIAFLYGLRYDINKHWLDISIPLTAARKEEKHMDENYSHVPPPGPPVRTYKKRYHRDANYESSPMPLGPFFVYQICDLACASDHTVRLHRQICHEISYIVSGEGVFFRNGKAFDVCPNAVFLVNDRDVHSIRSSKDSPIRFMCLGFAFNKGHPDFMKYADVCSFFETLQTPQIMDKNSLFNLFTLALNEVSGEDALSMEMLESYVRQIIILTYRNFTSVSRQKINFVSVNDTNPLLYEIAHYIDTHLTDIKKLSDIADVFDYSYAYLSRIFSQTMGIPIRDYYSQRRLEKAAEMLAEEIPVSAVSERLQFADVPSFTKAFKGHYGMPPKKYQQMAAEAKATLSDMEEN